ncbi:MAG: hypothetical protein HQK63_07920 [Desulfamplus sp.]|nr:hypothetical protein [Desulfamplus sp.]
MTWKVRIIGDPRDLDDLHQSFASGAIFIEKNGIHEYYLISDAFQDYTNDIDVSEKASQLISLISGASRLALGGNIPIAQSETVKVKEDGTELVFMHLQETLQVRDSSHLAIIDDEGNVVKEIKPADEVPNWVELGLQHESVAKVFRLYTQSLDWVGLYRIYEVIENDMGGLDALVSNGWAVKSKVKLFKHTSNSPGAIGDGARHGKESSQPPQQPMHLHEARNLVESLISSWLKSKQ